ncbi:dynamin family protein [Paenibacillus sp. ALJ109b]|uniref:dynamin family protein n=1 Tax=Paenibacillus sp. ALJ109b TaxID=2709068 RepID=UPI0013D1BA68|nr:dynamin family protein [Paenibacillus sp. ALJ109b]NEU62066.1 GTPase [Paenibacillus sp. ALJ109b]
MSRTDYPVEMAKPLLPLREAMEQTGDHTAVQALTDLISKAEMKQLTIAFCGHFSAGKSSLINSLCGKRVLPSSPVPTSANVVSIRNGEPRALIYTSSNVSADNSAGVLEVSPEQLEEYCKNGGAYTSIEVWDDIPLLKDDAVLLDTPGVDSTDQGHSLATHSALHLADVVFYVMDYNHVQSESNLSFAKSLSDWGKPLFLIVNQIDKHRERELSFDQYVEGVEAIFAAWEVRYDGLLFTSLRDKEHRYSQWKQLPQLIEHMMNEKEGLIKHSLASSASHVTEQHLTRQAEEREEEETALLEEVGGKEGIERLERELGLLDQKEAELRSKPSREREKFRAELEPLLANANLTPADIRTSAAAYLESRKPGFRVGLLFSGGKTEQEKLRRAAELVRLLQDQASGQVEVHIRTMLRQLGEAHQLWGAEWEQALNAELPAVDEALLEMKRSASAEVSPEYVLQFSKDIRGEIEARYRRSAMILADRLLEALGTQGEAALQALDASRAALLAQSASAARYTALQRAADAEAAGLRSLLPPAGPLTSGLLPEVQGPPVPAHEPGETPGPHTGTEESVAAQPQTPGAPPPRKAAVHGQPAAGAQRRRRLDAAAARLEAAAALVEPYPAMGSAVRDLRTRAASLAGGTFTLALFGAFSAGKSSFANALLGEAVLPVSPHPTTAAINRIMAPSGGAEHGTARVRMKTSDAFQEDLAYSFRLLGLGEPGADWQKRVKALSPQDVHPAGRPHYSFLQAAAAGWEDTAAQLGQDVLVDLNGYRNFVANEKKSCFVDSIDLYYSCDVTEQGIVLVDTPGADSVNARHTGVTFNYMKNADALIFVTYYNHAFSQGDRQFLNQLGRVKDSSAMDQMFFVVNASDLSSSEEELEQVLDHVSTQLRSNGIRAPRLFPVSSMLAMEGKTGNDATLLEQSGFIQFEEEFNRFAGSELADLAVGGASEEIARVIKRVKTRAEDAAQGEEVLQRRRDELGSIQEQSLQRVHLLAERSMKAELAQETAELLFHVRQRLGYRFGLFMAEAFHPSVLREDRGNLKAAFAACGRELLRMIAIELEQELLATTLRLEQAGQTWMHKQVTECVDELKRLSGGMDLSLPLSERWSTPVLEEVRLEEPSGWKAYLSYFRNPKQFFEGDGRQRLQEALDPVIKQMVIDVLPAAENKLVQFYDNQLGQSLQHQSRQLEERLEEAVSALHETMTSGIPAEEWESLSVQLGQIERE